MKFYLNLLIAGAALAGCSTTTDQQEDRILLSPHRLTFASTESAKNISITHTCTCPFGWTMTAKDSPAWLTFPTLGSGDDPAVLLTVDRAAAPGLPDSTTLYVRSNFGDDSIAIVLLP